MIHPVTVPVIAGPVLLVMVVVLIEVLGRPLNQEDVRVPSDSLVVLVPIPVSSALPKLAVFPFSVPFGPLAVVPVIVSEIPGSLPRN